MKKFFRYLLLLVGILLLAVCGFAAFVAIRGIPHYKAEHIDLKIEPTPARIAKGEKLATMLCASCHYNVTTGKLTGREMKEAPQFGQVFSRNITKDPQYGIGKWTDGELVYLIRTGLKPDGTYLPPYMAKLTHISDEDLYSIIAFLHSDNALVQPDTAHMPLTKPSFLTKFLCNTVIRPIRLWHPTPQTKWLGAAILPLASWNVLAAIRTILKRTITSSRKNRRAILVAATNSSHPMVKKFKHLTLRRTQKPALVTGVKPIL